MKVHDKNKEFPNLKFFNVNNSYGRAMLQKN